MAFLVALSTVACSSDEGPRLDATVGVEMTPLATEDYVKCMRFPQLRGACPRLVPATSHDVGHRSYVDKPAENDTQYWSFGVEWGAPYQNRLNARDRPPRFAHIEVQAGELRPRSFSFTFPAHRARVPGDRPAKSLGLRRWGGHRGKLLLAPPYPFGGLHGSHLLFLWSEEGRDYLISMHAWEPLNEAEETLRRIVESIA